MEGQFEDIKHDECVIIKSITKKNRKLDETIDIIDDDFYIDLSPEVVRNPFYAPGEEVHSPKETAQHSKKNDLKRTVKTNDSNPPVKHKKKKVKHCLGEIEKNAKCNKTSKGEHAVMETIKNPKKKKKDKKENEPKSIKVAAAVFEKVKHKKSKKDKLTRSKVDMSRKKKAKKKKKHRDKETIMSDNESSQHTKNEKRRKQRQNVGQSISTGTNTDDLPIFPCPTGRSRISDSELLKNGLLISRSTSPLLLLGNDTNASDTNELEGGSKVDPDSTNSRLCRDNQRCFSSPVINVANSFVLGHLKELGQQKIAKKFKQHTSNNIFDLEGKSRVIKRLMIKKGFLFGWRYLFLVKQFSHLL